MSDEAFNARLRSVLDTHLHPRTGSHFWLERVRSAGLDRDDLQTRADLARLGDLTPAEFRGRPLAHFVPASVLAEPARLVLAQTGGTSGAPVWTAYRDDEFDAAFVTPFAVAAAHAGFPRGRAWLYIGPSGPHPIGRAAVRLPLTVGSPEPFTVDFDPRWARRLPAGSVAAQRYLAHVVEQALDVIRTQEVGVLFATPPVLLALAPRMSDAERDRIEGVHHGGMPVTDEARAVLANDAFGGAVHLSGYGNSLLGCCLQLDCANHRPLEFFPHGDRLRLEVVDDRGAVLPPGGGVGRVRAIRLDHAFLLVNLLERDAAEAAAPPAGAPTGFASPGVRTPHPPAAAEAAAPNGLY